MADKTNQKLTDKSLENYEKELKEIKSDLEKLSKQGKVADEEMTRLQDRLRVIDSKQVDGKFMDEKGGIPPGQAILHELIDSCYDLKDQIMQKATPSS